MNFAKRMLAMVLAVLMVVTIAGCAGSKKTDNDVATLGDRSVSGELYTRFMMDAYTLADTYKDDPAANVLDTTVEGIPAAEWILKTARDDISRYLVTQEKFDETGMELSKEDREYVDAYAENMLEAYGTLFKAGGVDLEAMKSYYDYNVKSMALFDYYYAEGGEKEVPVEEIKNEVRKAYNLTKLMIFDKALITVDADGTLIEPTQEEIESAEAKARSYYDRAIAGEDFEDLIIEWELEYFGEDGIDHVHEEGGSHDLVTDVGSTSVPVAYSSVMDNAPYGEPQFIEDADVYYVAVRYDIGSSYTVFESYRSTMLLAMCSEDYRAMSDEWIAAADIVINDAALKNYPLENIAGIMAEATNSLAK
ncbi:MAG: hypothetical protein J6Q99_03520 [Oscillospiraceae bacterium]|nr:hypothetical protein [Oscillospiraceae bacterium]